MEAMGLSGTCKWVNSDELDLDIIKNYFVKDISFNKGHDCDDDVFAV